MLKKPAQKTKGSDNENMYNVAGLLQANTVKNTNLLNRIRWI